ncbi:MAG: phage portal protein [Bacteroidota bacterium]
MTFFDRLWGPTPADLHIAETAGNEPLPPATPQAMATEPTGQTFTSDSLAELVRQALAGTSGHFRGPHTFRDAANRICECDPLDVGIRIRARAASQVPIRLSRVKRSRSSARARLVRWQASNGALSPGQAVRQLDANTHSLGQADPHGALAHAVAMRQMHESGDLEPIDEHPLLDMLARPNPLTTTTWAQLLDAVVMQRVAWGEVFARPVTAGSDIARQLGRQLAPELYLVEDPSTVTVVLSADGTELAGYDQSRSAGARRQRKEDRGDRAALAPDTFVHIKDLDPLCHLRGRSHLRSLWIWTQIYLMAARWNGSLIKNGAKPSGVLSRRDGRAIGGRQRERVQADADRRSGPEEAGKAWTDGDIVWNQISLSPRDMDWGAVVKDAFRRISTGAGVDPILQGVGEYSTYNNQQTAMARLYTEAALPDLAWLLSGLNEGVVPLVGDGLVLWADPTEIPALRTNALELAQTLKASDWLTDAEKREAQGYPGTPETAPSGGEA